MKKVLIKLGIFIALILLNSNIGFSENILLEGYGLNTVAGYNTFLRTSQILPNTGVIFEVKKPDNEIVSLASVTNLNGVAQIEFPNSYTKKAGNYAVNVKFADNNFKNNINNKVNFFTVFSGEVSANVSTIYPLEQVVNLNNEEALLNVQLFDEYKNPIEGHLVKLISSSTNSEIEIVSSSNLTDSSGEIDFKVKSSDLTTVTYTVYDATSDKILTNRAKVVFIDSKDDIFNIAKISSYGLASAFGNSSFNVDHFKFENIPATIKVNESMTFTLSAVDSNEQVVQNYTGTVRFTCLGDNAFYVDLPADYTFTSQDLGSHTFSLVMTFKKNGTYKIEARDLDNTNIFEENIFNVGTLSSAATTTTLTITNPISGTYSNNIHVISGLSEPGAKLKIYDNDVELASIVADVNGGFSYTTSALVDGLHKIYITKVNDIGTVIETSPIVEINIDTSPPEIEKVVLEPSNTVDPGSVVTVKLYIVENISKASLIFQGNMHDLEKSAEGYFEGFFAAPIEFGEYPLSFTIKDQLGNEARIDNKAVLNVGGVAGAGQPSQGTKLGDAKELAAISADKRVSFNWKAPDTVISPIKNYRIYYGLSPTQLTEAVDTFTNSTTWYIPNLKNGVLYYFAVIAVDEKGNVSEHFSNIVSSTPGGAVVAVVAVPSPQVTEGTAGVEALTEMKKDASESGPEIFWLLLLSLFGGICYIQSAKILF